MPDYYIVDTHVRLYRTARLGWQGRAIYDRYESSGTIEELLRYMGGADISEAWVINSWPSLPRDGSPTRMSVGRYMFSCLRAVPKG